MKNLFYFVIIIICVGLIYVGLTRKAEPQQAQVGATAVQQPQTGVSVPSMSGQKAAPVAIGQVVQRFRPDTAAPLPGSNSAEQIPTAEQSFRATPDLQAKMYLVDAYKPGTCYGAPAAVSQAAVANLISANPPLSNYLKTKYGLATDLEIYNKLKQLQGITLTETASSKFIFTFIDGQCQTVVYYEGAVEVSVNEVNALVAKQTSQTFR